MKKIINNLNKEKVQRGLFLGLVVLVFGVFMLSIFLGNSSEDPNDPNKTPGQDINNPT